MLELLGDESQTENNFEPFSSAALSSYWATSIEWKI
jgi:hypothetical protein